MVRRHGRCKACQRANCPLPSRGLCWTCCRRPDRHLFPLLHQHRHWSAQELANAQELRRRGHTCIEIGWLLGRSRHSVKEALRRAQQKTPASGPHTLKLAHRTTNPPD